MMTFLILDGATDSLTSLLVASWKADEREIVVVLADCEWPLLAVVLVELLEKLSRTRSRPAAVCGSPQPADKARGGLDSKECL
jgi:hypothetical protein